MQQAIIVGGPDEFSGTTKAINPNDKKLRRFELTADLTSQKEITYNRHTIRFAHISIPILLHESMTPEDLRGKLVDYFTN